MLADARLGSPMVEQRRVTRLRRPNRYGVRRARLVQILGHETILARWIRNAARYRDRPASVSGGRAVCRDGD